MATGAPSALVTGASAGLGAEFARQLAQRGYHLVLVARDGDRLAERAAELTASTGVSVDVLPADLTTDDGTAAVNDRISRECPDVLVENAGMGTYQPFGATALEFEERQLDLNVRAVLRLTHAAVPAMTARGSGRIVVVSSVAGFVPRPGNVTYSASKAWVTMFAEALGLQLDGSGVTVTAVCPGFTHTEFHQRASADMAHVPERMWLDAADVVRAGLDDVFAGKPLSIPSRRYQVLVNAARSMPRPLLREIMRRRGM